MTSVPPTQPPAAPETDVRLTEAERVALDAAVGALGSEDYPGVLFDEAERIVAERLRVVEGERDAAQAEVAEVRYELGDALTTLETALMGTPSSGCAWSVVGAPACQAGTREHSFWCRHCLVRSMTALTARAESAEAAHEALRAGLRKMLNDMGDPMDPTHLHPQAASLMFRVEDLLAGGAS